MNDIITKRNQRYGKCIFISLLCMYINNPFYFSAIENLNKAIYYCIALSPVIYVVLHCFITVKRGVLNYIKYIVFYIICAYMVTVITGSHDMQYMTYFFRHLVGIIGMYAAYMMWADTYKKNKISIRFEEIYMVSLLIYIGSTLLFLAVPGLKNVWLGIITHYGNDEMLTDRQEYVTRIGIAGYSGFGTAFQTAMGLIYYASMYINNRLSRRKKVMYLIVLLIGCMFYGRIGTIMGVVILMFIAVHSVVCKKKMKLFVGIICFVIIIGIVAIICFVIIIGIVAVVIYKYATGPAKNFVDWAFEPVIHYFEHGTFSSASSSSLEATYARFHPSSETLLHGNGYWLNEDGTYYGHSDVGFMRNIYYGGVIYTLITYGCVVFVLFSYFKYARKYHQKGRFFITFLCMILFVAFEMKGDITFGFVKAFMPLYLCVYYSDVYV